MKKFLENPEKLNALLKKMFERNLTRFSQTEYDSDTSDLKSFAQAIYKRGILSSNNKFKLSNEFTRPETVCINENELFELFEHFKEASDSCFIIMDKKFYSLNKHYFLELEIDKNIFFLDATEENKNLDTVSKILNAIKNYEHASEIQNILGIGGGITLDVAGFVASVLQTKLTLIPTTLLAAVDATIGGKTGVNFESYGKNQVGSFYFCDQIIFFKEFLYTLSQDEIISGLCEMLKHSWLAGDFLGKKVLFEHILLSGFTFVKSKLDALVVDNLNLKLKIVEQDPFETIDVRTMLNFGHTMGHAIESLSHEKQMPLSHGVSVAHGMMWCLNNFYDCNTKAILEFKEFLQKITNQFPNDFILNSKDSLTHFLVKDKKNTNSINVKFVLPPYGFVRR